MLTDFLEAMRSGENSSVELRTLCPRCLVLCVHTKVVCSRSKVVCSASLKEHQDARHKHPEDDPAPISVTHLANARVAVSSVEC